MSIFKSASHVRSGWHLKDQPVKQWMRTGFSNIRAIGVPNDQVTLTFTKLNGKIAGSIEVGEIVILSTNSRVKRTKYSARKNRVSQNERIFHRKSLNSSWVNLGSFIWLEKRTISFEYVNKVMTSKEANSIGSIHLFKWTVNLRLITLLALHQPWQGRWRI